MFSPLHPYLHHKFEQKMFKLRIFQFNCESYGMRSTKPGHLGVTLENTEILFHSLNGS